MKVTKRTRRYLARRRKLAQRVRQLFRAMASEVDKQMLHAVDLEHQVNWLKRRLQRQLEGEHWILVLEQEQNQVYHFEGPHAEQLAKAAYANNVMPKQRVTTIAKVHTSCGEYTNTGKVVVGAEVPANTMPLNRYFVQDNKELPAPIELKRLNENNP